MLRHARLTLPDDQLDALHVLKRHLSKERGQRVTIEQLLAEGAALLLRYYAGTHEVEPEHKPPV